MLHAIYGATLRVHNMNMLLVAATASNMLPRLTQQAPSPSISPTSAKLLDSEVKAPALPPPSFLVTAPICSVRGPRCPSTPLDPCAQSAARVSQPADWQRSTRRSGPGATAATKLVRLGQRPTSSFKAPASGSPIFCFPEPERSHQMLVCMPVCVRTCR